MKPASREQAVFAAALERVTPEARAAYLETACGTDAALRQRVEALLRAGANVGNFLEKPPTGLMGVAAGFIEKPGDRIGRYKLLQQIGEGGCGVVYMAEQEEPVRRHVALKVIKLGMDTKSVIARFEAERQALAMMDHPNIAKVLDAGATEMGRPYFVMELVRGLRITDYCDQSDLPTEERLKLFTQVCQAIQHAHQKGIIHRDIKPSNILIADHDGVPVPKVIDFGIAKATTGQRLTDKTVFTAFEQFIGTPAYMSPEQANLSGLDIDTRTDIYALGVLLYELLTGQTPFDGNELMAAGLDAMRRIIREQEPARPSTRLSTLLAADLTTVASHRRAEPGRLGTLLRGDLDWIVMKALEKDRTRRYETANGLAADIQRHLDNEPVVARPPSAGYRLQKLIRRNKLAFAAVSAVVIALVFGLGISTLMFFKENQARERAVAAEQESRIEASKSLQVAQFMKDMLKGVGPSVALGRDTTMLREIVDKTAERISTDLKDQPEVAVELRLVLAQVYFDLQLYKKMEETARVTLQLAHAKFGEENLAVADSLGQIGRALFYMRDLEAAETFTRKGIAMQRKLRGTSSLQEAASLGSLGDVMRHQWYRAGRPKSMAQLIEAETAIRASIEIFRRRLGNNNDEVAWAFHALQHVLADEGRGNEAEAAIREGLAIRLNLHGEEHPFTGTDYCCLGDSMLMQNRFEEAASSYQKGLAIIQRTIGKSSWHQAWAQNGLALALASQSKTAEAEVHHREALRIARQEMGPDHSDLPEFIERLANHLRKRGTLDEAESLYREALAAQRKLPGGDSKMSAFLSSLSFVLQQKGEWPEAETTLRESLATQRKVLEDKHPDVVASLNMLAEMLRAQGKLAEPTLQP